MQKLYNAVWRSVSIAIGITAVILISIGAVAAVSLTPAVEPVAEDKAVEAVTPMASGFVSVNGKEIVGPSGAPLLLRGISLGHWLLPEGYMMRFSGAENPRAIAMIFEQLVGESAARDFWRQFRQNYITRADIRFIKEVGFNSIRVPFHYNLFLLPTEPPIFGGPGYALLDQVIGWAREEGLYVILDMHAAPGGQTGGVGDDSWGHPYLYDDERSQELTSQLWMALAARYRDEPTVLGYDLLNEPIAHHVDMDRLNPKLEPLFKRLVADIRTVDDNHIIILEGTRWATSFSIFGEPFDDKLVYSFHKYWVDPNYDNIREFAEFRDKYNVPLWMGESGEATDEWIRDWRTVLEENNIGWAFWPYKSMDTGRSVVAVTKTESWDALVNYAKEPLATISRAVSHRPPQSVIEQALSEYLENIKLENTSINRGYLKALGLNQEIASVTADAPSKDGQQN
jgi:hypothetical protein